MSDPNPLLFNEITAEYTAQRKLVKELRSKLIGCSGDKLVHQQTALTQALTGLGTLAETIAKLNSYED